MAKSNDIRNQIADRYAIGEDLEHAVRCTEKLLAPIEGYDETDGRALWQSALISFRRASANAATMGPASGGVQNPIARSVAKQSLPDHLHDRYDELLTLADKTVAHRTPIAGQREMNVQLGDDGSFTAVSLFSMPSNSEIESLKDVIETLFRVAINLDSIENSS